MRPDITARSSRRTSRARQAGLTLIEFMISIVLGMIVVAAIAMLISNQSVTRSETDRAGRLIENGRYSMQTMVEDLQNAGYWGELTTVPTATTPTALPDPCSTVVTSGNAASPGIQEATYLHVQGYDDSVMTSSTLSCVSHWKTGTDVLVVRRADPTVNTIAALVDGTVYLQTGLTSATGTVYSYKMYTSNSGTNSTNFNLVKKDGTTASIRQMLVHIYYVSTCDVCSGSSADTIPTLKRVELSVSSGSPSTTCSSCTVTIAEGVENLQFEFGRDTDGDGAPDGTDGDSSAFGLTDWSNAMSVKIYLLMRATEASPNYTDTKSYAVNSATSASAAAGFTNYQRHLFLQSVRLANPSLRRSS